MPVKKGQDGSITQPILKDLIQRHKVEVKTTLANAACVDQKLLAQPALYQDPAQGYNANFVFPQD